MRTPVTYRTHRLLLGSVTALLVAACSPNLTGLGDSWCIDGCSSGSGYTPTGTVRIDWSSDSVAVGDTLRAVARLADLGGNAVPNATFSWSSFNPAVATVDSTGLIRALAPGEAIISVSGSAPGSDGGAIWDYPKSRALRVVSPAPPR